MSSNSNETPTNNGSILDVILEKCSNSEKSSNNVDIKKALNEILKTHGKREKNLRKSTITFRTNEKYQLAEISQYIDTAWTIAKSKAPANYWADKVNAYVQFVSEEEKNAFLDWAVLVVEEGIQELLVKPTKEGEYITRRPIKVMISNVRANIKAERIREVIYSILTDREQKIFDIREGKMNNMQRRSILFEINNEAFKVLFGTLDGALPYTNGPTNTKIRLIMKINCKPWTCRDCFAIGKHQCEGRVCAQCGLTGHMTKECVQKTKYCKNCKQKGHRSRDTHCPVYLNEISKEIRKMDFPIEYFEDKDLRFNLTKHIQLK